MLDRFAISAAAQLVLLLYLELIEWVNLFPWNDIGQGNGQAGLDIFLGVILLAGAIASVRRWKPLLWVPFVVYVIWMALQIVSWWAPYIRGASAGWQQVYLRNFSQTIQWLPRSGNHLPPDAAHLVLQILIVWALCSVGFALFRAPQTKLGRLRRGASSTLD
jgi:hypothetical protein